MHVASSSVTGNQTYIFKGYFTFYMWHLNTSSQERHRLLMSMLEALQNLRSHFKLQ